MSAAAVDPFGVSQGERIAQSVQQAALDKLRAQQLAANSPRVFLPFGKQQPLAKYAGMKLVPFQKNRHLSQPEVLLKHPEPGMHYGFVNRSDPEIRGKIRAGMYVPVYIDEIDENTPEPIFTEDVVTEAGPNKLVLWFGLTMVKIPPRWHFEMYEEPALSSATRLMAHREAFMDFSMESPGGGNYRDLRDKAQVSMEIHAG